MAHKFLHSHSDKRLTALRSQLKEERLDSILICDFYNVLYLTGFKTTEPAKHETFVLVTKDSCYLFSNYLYISKEDEEKTRGSSIRLLLLTRDRRLPPRLAEILQKEHIKRLGFESESLTVAELQILQTSDTQWISTSQIVQKLRSVKDNDEVELVKKASELSDECLADVLPNITKARTEKEILHAIQMWILNHGLEESFPAVVASAANSATPHYDTKEGSGMIKDGNVILIDMGVKYQNYHSDITRVFFKGRPDNESLNVYEKVLKIQKQAVEQSPKNPDLFCQEMFKKEGFPPIPHSGHGLGLEIHELPRMFLTEDFSLKPFQTFTIEPGVYFYEKFGIRIEDTVYTDQSLKIHQLTQFPKEPLIV